MEQLVPRAPLMTVGKIMISLIAIGFALMWILAIYWYLTLPDEIPIHFNFAGEATTYGRKATFIILPASLSVAPIIFLVITKYRFTLLNKYPYLINIPAFYANIGKIPYERRGEWINKYFEAVLTLGVLMTIYFILLELGIYQGTLEGRLPSWFIPTTLLMPIAFIAIFIYQMKTLSKKLQNYI